MSQRLPQWPGRDGAQRTLTEDMIEAARSAISGEEKDRLPCFSALHKDAIRRWAYAIGDGNPLWLDEEYAAASRWRGILSPPTFPETSVRGPFFNPLKIPRRPSGGDDGHLASSPKRSRSSGLPGLGAQGMGRQVTFHAPARVNDELRGTQSLVGIVDSQGRVAEDCIALDADVDSAMQVAKEACAFPDRRIIMQVFENKVYSRTSGRLLMRSLRYDARFERPLNPLEVSKYRNIPAPHYTDDEIADVIAMHNRETLRGSEILWWESVQIGDELPALVKGPYTPSDYIVAHSAFGSWFDLTDRLKYLFIQQYPGSCIVDPRTNVPDFPDAMHFDEFVANAVGMPRGFDAAFQRYSWFGHLITNWMGDDAFLPGLTVWNLSPLFLYDTMWLRGCIVAKNESDSTVSLELSGVNQRGETVNRGTAKVVLQNKSGLPFSYT